MIKYTHERLQQMTINKRQITNKIRNGRLPSVGAYWTQSKWYSKFWKQLVEHWIEGSSKPKQTTSICGFHHRGFHCQGKDESGSASRWLWI